MFSTKNNYSVNDVLMSIWMTYSTYLNFKRRDSQTNIQLKLNKQVWCSCLDRSFRLHENTETSSVEY